MAYRLDGRPAGPSVSKAMLQGAPTALVEHTSRGKALLPKNLPGKGRLGLSVAAMNRMGYAPGFKDENQDRCLLVQVTPLVLLRHPSILCNMD